ncbi:MAG: efflux RND transporter periplasmic adaptor subunit [Blastocatellia bacterium]|nr:efflux RND transporter periplasmic adaptor subunit [Blastocatellia bacterium]
MNETTNPTVSHQEPEKTHTARTKRKSRMQAKKAFKMKMVAIGTTVVVGTLVLSGIFWKELASRPQPEPAKLRTAAKTPEDFVSPDEAQKAQITVEPVTLRNVTLDRNATGKVGFNEDHLTPVFSPFAGRVMEIQVNKGDTLRAGAPLLGIDSPDVVAAENDVASARAEVAKARISLDIARTAAERATRLHEKEALALKDLQQAQADVARCEGDYQRAQTGLTSAENKLTLFGLSAEDIAKVGKQVSSRVTFRAPIGGTVVERKVGLGQYLKPDAADPVFVIADLSTVWVQADVYESDLASVKLNAPVSITVPAYPSQIFPAKITFISPTVDPATRTIRVRCTVENPQRLLKPDMFANIVISGAAAEQVPVIPSEAIVTEGDSAAVFVEISPGRFLRRQITVGPEEKGMVIVKNGLKPGENIAVRGALLLDELTKSSDEKG